MGRSGHLETLSPTAVTCPRPDAFHTEEVYSAGTEPEIRDKVIYDAKQHVK